jgi:Flp pilus assembly protein TadD
MAKAGRTQTHRSPALNLRGVSALNHNDPQSAQKFFNDAYKLDPSNAFTLNNIGYVAK